MSPLARGVRAAAAATALLAHPLATRSADHLDTPTVTADPAADIGDLFAWTSPDGRRLELAMTVVAHRFSDALQYVFHVDSGPRFGTATRATSDVVCTFDAAGAVSCAIGDDVARGLAGDPGGLVSTRGRFRVFAGLRDDPFFNNVEGTRAALNRALAARATAARDEAGCPRFDAATVQAIRTLWRATDGGPAANFLAGWKSAALVVSVELPAVTAGGPALAVWAGVHRTPDGASGLGEPIERIGRPLTANAFVGLLAADEAAERRKEDYNRAAPGSWPSFAPDIEESLAFYDGFDGVCGNQWSAGRGPRRYRALAEMLADDRIRVDATVPRCRQLLAVERQALSGRSASDGGGRTPDADVDVLRSLLVSGTTTSIDDGVDLDDADASTSAFPFLAAPR